MDSTGLSTAVDWPTLPSLALATDMQTSGEAQERFVPTEADATSG
jgi:hypothetical protein